VLNRIVTTSRLTTSMLSANERRLRKWHKECELKGEHVPWLRVGSFASRGIQSRIRGRDDALVAHLHTNGVKALYLRLAFTGGLIRIRSYVPLEPLDHVRNLARLMNVRMPWDEEHNDWAVLTTELVVERACRGRIKVDAYAVTARGDSRGSRGKLGNTVAIKKAYWRHAGADFTVVNANDLDATETRNIDRLYSELNYSPCDALPRDRATYAQSFLAAWHRDRTLEDILHRTERRLGLTRREGWTLFASTVQSGLLPVDLTAELAEHKRVLLMGPC
jgi:hypothetical protein